MTASDGGKGSAPRPIPDPQKFRDNWDAIFGKKDKPSAVDDCATAKAESASNTKSEKDSK